MWVSGEYEGVVVEGGGGYEGEGCGCVGGWVWVDGGKGRMEE